MKPMRPMLLLLPSVLLSACAQNLEPYYSAGQPAPTISELSVTAQLGSLSGATVVISGQNFGGNADAITVVFGHQNAKVISSDGTEMSVVVPHGPVQGGSVDVAVGTEGGQTLLEDAYTYELPARNADQIAYITIANDGMSCYGGIYNTDIAGCEGINLTGEPGVLTGETGIAARGEGFEFTFPKAHIPHSLGKGGFAQANDISWEEWAVITQPFALSSADLSRDTEGQRINLGEVTLTNTALAGKTDCINYGYFSRYTYNGGDAWSGGPEEGLLYPNVSVTGSSSTLAESGICSDDNLASGLAAEVELDTLRLCQTDEPGVTNTFVYEGDWLSSTTFFQAADDPDSDIPQAYAAVPVTLNIPNAGIIDVELTLPEVAEFLDVNDDFSWPLRDNGGFIDEGLCVDDDDLDRTTDGGDSVFTWQWEPSAVEHDVCPSCDVKSVDSYVVATLSYFSFSWLGGDGLPMIATITVPDDHNLDTDTGLSELSMPSWVLYSMPTSNVDIGFVDSSWAGWGDPADLSYGYLVVTLDRVTEFTLQAQRIESPSGVKVDGDIVVAYSTGDMGYFAFDNPLDNLDVDECSDCIDNDGDGWADEQDPDCEENAKLESSTTSLYTCNDDIDNDGDGLTDWEDTDCSSGVSDAEIDDCSNELDDDGDGWIDEEDPDCLDSVFEENETSRFTCNDSIDNDSDGWIDEADPACTNGNDSEDDGIQDSACNNGIDDDGHGDPDALDLYCMINGAEAEAEQDLRGDCIDGIDNDSDGYIDGNDPDCEVFTVEIYASYADILSGVPEIDLQCYNGIDDDGDGEVDALDPGCFEDGFSSDESAADPAKNDCVDGLDNDGDGWVDSEDPDCSFGTEEVDLSSSACNDGVDNDGDTFTDQEDSDCVDGFDNDEAG
jgi:hypothetical protein